MTKMNPNSSAALHRGWVGGVGAGKASGGGGVEAWGVRR
jgi:hypothetical protein